jgi:hypothetical protein
MKQTVLVNSISYEELKRKIEYISDKIICVVVTKEECLACEHFIKTSISKLEDDKLETYTIDINDIPTTEILPLPLTPLTYFYIKGSDVFPVIRQGMAEFENLKNEIKQFKRVLKGEKFNEVF